MPFHLAAYNLAIGAVADTDVPAVVDDILTIQNNHFVLSKPLNLISAWVGSPTLSRAKIASPSMRQIVSPYVRPINVAALPANNPNVWLLHHNPFTINWGEEIQVLGTAAPGTTERFTALIWLAEQIQPQTMGNMIPLRFTSTTAAVAFSWTTITLTFADTLPSGVYSMVQSECQSTNAVAHRWIISNQLYRPGHLSFAALGSRLPNAIGMGQLGQMGTFRSNDLPRLQVLANVADAAHEGYLWVQRVGNLT